MTHVQRDYEWTVIETEYGRIKVTFEPDQITWTGETGQDISTERLAREELVVDAAMGVISDEMEW